MNTSFRRAGLAATLLLALVAASVAGTPHLGSPSVASNVVALGPSLLLGILLLRRARSAREDRSVRTETESAR